MTSRDECDRLFSRVVRARDGRCQNDECARSGPLECAHLFSRRYERTRCDERNAVALCSRCHAWFTGHPIEWEAWCRDRLGFAYELLSDLATGKDLPLLVPRPDWTEIASTLRIRLKELT